MNRRAALGGLASLPNVGRLPLSRGAPAAGRALHVTVYFDGVPILCMVDTGAGRTTLRQSAAARIGTLGPWAGTDALLAFGGGVIHAALHRVLNVGTGNLGWAAVDIAVVPDSALPYDGILGADLLYRQRIVIDPAAGVFAASV